VAHLVGEGKAMLRPKKRIPKLAVAALALTGCGSDGPNLGGAVNAFCMKVVDCFPDYTLEECTGPYNEYFQNYNLGDSCQAALATYFSCLSTLSCDQLGTFEGCEDEFYAIESACSA